MTVLMGLGFRLRMAKLHLITDARSSEGDLESFAARVFDAGVDMLQLRDSRLTTYQLVRALELLRKAAMPSQGLVVTNDVNAAAVFKSDVLHLGVGVAQRAKKRMHQYALLGRSAHTLEQINQAVADPAVDYLFIGSMGETTKHLSEGPDLVREAAAALPPFAMPERSKPWFAAGGVTPKNLRKVISLGARRVCVSRAILQADDPVAVTKSIKEPLVAAWHEDPAANDYTMGAFND